MSRSKSGKKKAVKSQELQVIHPHAAGIDVGAESHFVAVPPGGAADGRDVREFQAFTAGLHELSAWLKACGVTTVALESTGVYWIPLFELLEADGLEVLLVDPRRTRHVSGRKSDVIDCQWIQQLHAYGLLAGAFRPEEQLCVLRSYLRQRGMLVEQGGVHIQHMQKALTQMNLKLQHVVSDITGVTGLKILRAIVGGERDARKLAQLRDGRCKHTVEEITKALQGNYRREHLFALRQALEAYDFCQRQMGSCDEQLEAHLKSIDPPEAGTPAAPLSDRARKAQGNAPQFDLRTELHRMLGVDLTEVDGLDAYTAAKVVGEIGRDMTRWPSVKHFTSWLGLCPGTKISGGRKQHSHTKPCANKAASALRVAAQTLMRSKCALGAFLRRKKSQLGPAGAITAAAHKLARIIYTMLSKRCSYVDIGEAAYEAKHEKRTIEGLKKKAKQFGFQLVALTA